MSRSEYLETIDGQLNQRWKRRLKTRYFSVTQEPKSKKGQSAAEKARFRAEIKQQLSEFNRRAHRGDVVLEIDFTTTQNNPPAIHTLAKNYLDLLHKPMPSIDDLKGILFKDDGQVKILIVNYHLASSEEREPGIFLKCQSLGAFIQDLELANRIINNDFADADYNSEVDISDRHEYYDLDDDIDNLRDMEARPAHYIKTLGRVESYEGLKQLTRWRIQEWYLETNSLDERRILLMLSQVSHRVKRYGDLVGGDLKKQMEDNWKDLRKRFLITSNFLELGHTPQKEGETIRFKDAIKEKFHEFRKRHKLLFPLIVPISVSIIFVPPKNNIPDLDNLARCIVPFVNEIFEPPSNLSLSRIHQDPSEEFEKIRNRPPNSISSYQLVHLPREDSDPEHGKIFFIISGGLMSEGNIWRKIDGLIDAWKRQVR